MLHSVYYKNIRYLTYKHNNESFAANEIKVFLNQVEISRCLKIIHCNAVVTFDLLFLRLACQIWPRGPLHINQFCHLEQNAENLAIKANCLTRTSIQL